MAASRREGEGERQERRKERQQEREEEERSRAEHVSYCNAKDIMIEEFETQAR